MTTPDAKALLNSNGQSAFAHEGRQEEARGGGHVFIDQIHEGRDSLAPYHRMRIIVQSPLAVSPPRARQDGLPLTTTRELFAGHRQLGRWSGLGRTAGGGAYQL